MAPRVGGGVVATYVSRMWTVILGELVVNCLVEIGSGEIDDARKVRKAGRSSLEDIGGRWGVLGGWEVRYNKGFSDRCRAGGLFRTHDVIQSPGICQGSYDATCTPPLYVRVRLIGPYMRYVPLLCNTDTPSGNNDFSASNKFAPFHYQCQLLIANGMISDGYKLQEY